ncbi:MAG: acyl-CoA dehydrogenase [Actinobacteria bacterium]|nr:acyl-CoA dehydrogenase [Actinomycetota bacterium]
MNFDDTPEQAAFRQEVRAWLDANARLRSNDSDVWRTLRPRNDTDDKFALERAKKWQAVKYDAGYVGLNWPTEFGGRGLSAHIAAVFKQEEARYDVPANAFQVGVDMVGPTLIRHGSAAITERFLDPIRRGDEFWCQLFSEPGAGSDLAGLSTKAVRDGDAFVVNGQKVWTTTAHWADYGLLLARTNPEVSKHQGITAFIVDMSTPGIEIRPLRQADGAEHFNEVFFTDVVVPAENVIGEIDAGWGVAHTMLTSERSAIGGGGMVQFDEVAMLAEHFDRRSEPLIRQDLARLYSYFEITRFLGYRVQTALSHGQAPGPESSIMKLHISRQYEFGSDVIEALMGAAGTLWEADAPYGGFFNGLFLAQWAPRIGGGTDQIQRNIVGERVLGLPAEPRVDR